MGNEKLHPTIGSIMERGDEIFVDRGQSPQGWIYKNWHEFYEGNGTCYVPELDDTTYSRDDFLQLCNGQEDIAEDVFQSVDWQRPETYVDELFREGELAGCDRCGKWYWAYNTDRCPCCNAPRFRPNLTHKQVVSLGKALVAGLSNGITHPYNQPSDQEGETNG